MKQGIRRIAITGFLWTFFQKVGEQIVSFVVFAVLARLLLPEDFGLVAMATVSIAFLTLLTGAGLTSALVQRPEINAMHLDTMFWVVVCLSLILGAGTWWFAPAIAIFFKEPELQGVIRWLVVCLPLGALQQIQVSILRRELNFRSLAMRLLVSQPIAGVIGISLALLGFGVWSLVARIIATAAIRTIIMWFTVKWRPQFAFSLPHFRQLFGFGINVMGANFVKFFSARIDVFLIGYILGAGPLGIYTIAKRLVVLLVELVGGTIEHVAWPIFSRLQNDTKKVVAAFHRATQLASMMAFPVFAGVAFLSDDIIPVVFGDQWTASAQLMQVLACIGLVQAILHFHETLMVGMGRPDLKLRLQAVLAIANLVAFFIAIRFGLLAVTIGYAIVSIALAPIWIVCVRMVITLDLRAYFGNYRSATIGTIVMVFSVLATSSMLRQHQMMQFDLAIQVLSGFLAYILVVFLLEREFVVGIVRSVLLRRNSNV